MNKFRLSLLALPFFLPLLWRLIQSGATAPLGFLSDAAMGGLGLFLALLLPRWLRIVPLGLWCVFQLGAAELAAAVRRFPSWQDAAFLADPAFVRNSTAGFHFAEPLFCALLALALLAALILPAPRPRAGTLIKLLVAVALLLGLHTGLDRRMEGGAVLARFNALHWFGADVLASLSRPELRGLREADLPADLRELDLDAASLVGERGRAQNVLLVILEGLSGSYHPEIARAKGITTEPIVMKGLAAQTADAMLLPDFQVHSVQTIRGEYAALCGDFSKFSMKTPKAYELQANPERARDCLPAQLAGHGLTTHYLQGAGLAFMNKDRIMPLIGFQETHGSEWFSDPDPYPFEWGASDLAFLRGARKYVAGLRTAGTPWMLTLLTVGTHQPYAVPPEIEARYPGKLEASVAMLDQAVAEFLQGLRDDGVLEDTLIIITSDESHGTPAGEWGTSWGLGAVLAPEQARLPRFKGDSYGLVDLEASILDYLGLPAPAAIIGRSLFRDYQGRGRTMLSYTGNKLRAQTADGLRFECGQDFRCRVGRSPSLLGPLPEDFGLDREKRGPLLFAWADLLDRKLIEGGQTRTMQFANGEIRRLPEKIGNEWSDNLCGAQYLEFPAGSTVDVSIGVRAVKARAEGIQLKLVLREWEQLVYDVKWPQFPVLHAGEVGRLSFSFYTPRDRQSFSFHLVGEGKDSEIKLEDFSVTIHRKGA